MARLTSPSRVLVIISTTVAVLVLLLASGVSASSLSPAGGPDPGERGVEASVEVRVRSGDTLWGIASAHTPAGGDVRETIADIRAINALSDSLIHPGDRLTIPVFDPV